VQSRTVLVTGASGFIGSHLLAALARDGHRVVRLARPSSRPARGASEIITWDPATRRIDRDALRRAAPAWVINLAGERIDQRWTESARRAIRDSRVAVTAALSVALAELPTRPLAFLSGSAVGVYGAHRGDETLTESSTVGDDFLASVARDWEEATRPAIDAGIRVVHLRTGVVFGPGGALKPIRRAFQWGAGGRMGSGRQWMSWIAREEYPDIVRHLLVNDSVAGPVNVVSPEPVTNATLTRLLSRILNRPAIARVPAFALELLFGTMARDTILGSQRALPAALERSGYVFRFADPEQALRLELAR
jgi:uncharacterized protein (TIGR01777 family)